MDPRVEVGLLLLACFGGVWATVYARRAFQNTKRILEKLGH
ncbi:MAG: hypothetical protein AB1898_24015 [Acidobacteriota bacterium]